MREGVVYTPASIGPRGCVLYRVSVPGGRAPAALMYRSREGQFSYDRPDRCVTAAFGAIFPNNYRPVQPLGERVLRIG